MAAAVNVWDSSYKKARVLPKTAKNVVPAPGSGSGPVVIPQTLGQLYPPARN